MSNDFIPIPEIGVKYVKPNGEVIKVKDVYRNNGSIPDFVEYIDLSDNSNSIKEALMSDWNDLGLHVYDRNENIEDMNHYIDNDSKMPDDSSMISEKDGNNQIMSYKKGSPDEKLNILSYLLNGEPFTKLPFNIPGKILNFNDNEEIHDNEIKDNDVIKEIDAQIQEIRDIREEGRKPGRRSSFLNEFLWSCAGVDKPLLRMSSQDYAKKAGLGGTILVTALMAMLSGGYAIYTVFQESDIADKAWLIAILFGIFWGVLIFNLDRYMVNSMYTDGKSSISRKEFLSGLPRIIMAILLGMVISTPIELLIFNGKINSYIEEQAQIKMANAKKTYESDAQYLAASAEYKKEIKELKRIDSLYDVQDKRVEQYRKDLNDEMKTGFFKRSEAKEAQLSYAQAQLQEIKNNRNTCQDKLQTWRIKLDSLMNKAEMSGAQLSEEDKGLATRIQALMKVSKEHGLWLPRILIAILFIFLEIVPVLSKMMMPNGKYDKWLDKESDLTSLKIRCDAYNLYELTRLGKLGPYANEIMGNISSEKHKYDVSETDKDNIAEKHNFRKENQLRLDNENQETFMLVTSEVGRYLQHKILEILSNNEQEEKRVHNNGGQEVPDDTRRIG